MAGNSAVEVNSYSPQATQDLTERGSDWLWAAFSIMMVSNLVVFVWHLTLPRGQRVFHQLGMVILTTASIAYFTMASNYGKSAVPVEFQHANGFPVGTTRALWYVRYIDWVITTPALLLELTLATGLPLSDVITVVFFDLVMIITGLVGGLIPTSYKWGFFVFGMFALFYVWWVLAGPARTSARALGGGFARSFTISASILSILWLVYPVIWGVADGGNVITTDSEMVAYGILDVLAKPVFLFIHLFLLSKEDLSALQLSSGKFSNGVGAHNTGAVEKGVHAYPGGGANLTGASSYNTKKGMFGRKGRHDATTAPATNISEPSPPRPSEATAVSPH